MRDYGNAIKILRKNNQMTQTTLAEKLNVSGQAVSKWENNLAQPDFDTILKLTEIFSITLDEFTKLCSEKDAEEELVAAVAPATHATAPAPLLLGVCSRCGVSIYNEEELAERDPKILCKKCKDNIERAEKRAKKEAEEKRKKEAQAKAQAEAVQRYENTEAFRKSMLKPLWIVIPVVVLALIIVPSWFWAIIPASALLYLVVVMVKWDNNWIADIFDFTFGNTFAKPGLIIPLSLDGFIWALCVKLAMSIIWFLLSLAVTLFGLVLCMLLAPFCFPFALKDCLAHVRNNTFVKKFID